MILPVEIKSDMNLASWWAQWAGSKQTGQHVTPGSASLELGDLGGFPNFSAVPLACGGSFTARMLLRL